MLADYREAALCAQSAVDLGKEKSLPFFSQVSKLLSFMSTGMGLPTEGLTKCFPLNAYQRI
jgi:hypothetical protein